jgi:hypothetical protein
MSRLLVSASETDRFATDLLGLLRSAKSLGQTAFRPANLEAMLSSRNMVASSGLRSATDTLLSILAPMNRDEPLPDLSRQEWEDLLAAARRGKIETLLFERVRGKQQTIPEEVSKKLSELVSLATTCNLGVMAELRATIGILKELRIPVIVLKGPHIAQEIYGRLSLRLMRDLDLLLPREHIVHGWKQLQRRGYRPQHDIKLDARSQMTIAKHCHPLALPGGPSVELHWTITRPGQLPRVDVQGLWERAVPISLARVQTFGLCPEDLILHLCIHLSYDHRFGWDLRSAFDLAAAVKHYGAGLDWDILVNRSREWNATLGVYLALRVAGIFAGCQLPPQVERSLTAGMDTQVLADLLEVAKEEQLAGPPAHRLGERAGEVWHFKGVKPLTQTLWRGFFPAGIVMASQYPVAPDSVRMYWYYLVRVRDVFRRYWRTCWALATQDERTSAALARRTILNRALGKAGKDQSDSWVASRSGSANMAKREHV